jgi:hypothetical protein
MLRVVRVGCRAGIDGLIVRHRFRLFARWGLCYRPDPSGWFL